MKAVLHDIVRRPWYGIYLVLIIAAGVKQWDVYRELVDTQEYLNAASNLFHTGFPDSCLQNCQHWLHETRRTLGFPIILLIFGFKSYLVIGAQMVISALIPAWTVQLSKQLKLPDFVHQNFGWFFLLYPLQYFYTGFVMPEIWCQMGILLSFIFYYKKEYSKLGLIIVMLILLKPVFILTVPLLVYLWIRTRFKQVWLLLPVAVILVVSLWNMQKTSKLHYSSMGTENIWEYNQKAVLDHGAPIDGRTDPMTEQSNKLEHLNFLDRYNFMKTVSRQTLLDHWQIYLWLHAKGSFLALFDPGRYDFVTFMGINDKVGFMGANSESSWINRIRYRPIPVIMYLLIFGIIALIKIVLSLRAFIQNMKLWGLILIIITIFVSVTGPVGSARYLFPFMPLICLMATHGLFYTLKKQNENPVN